MLVNNCLECDILTGKLDTPGGVVYEDNYWVVRNPLSPLVLPGYLILRLKRHCEQLADLTPEETATLGPTLQKTCKAIMHVVHPVKIYVGSFGEDVAHIHFHIIPRMHDMPMGSIQVLGYIQERRASYRAGQKDIACSDAEAIALAEQLRVEF